MNDLDFITGIIAAKQDLFLAASKKIWEYAELPYEEFKSAKLLEDLLIKEGFTLKKPVVGMPTAFIGSFGEGKPVFGFLGEYDALDGLSQEVPVTKKQPVKEGAPGHGCGHNLLGVGSLAAAIACKEYLKETKKEGTVLYFGCPAEEGAGSKQFMARAGVFTDVDFIYTWHPSTENEVQATRTVAIMGANFEFRGKTAHAGSSPHLGRSALDTAELMNIGVNYLREHMIDQARIHYAYADAGGTAPNVVQDYSRIKYEVRAPKVAQVKELFARVVNVAKGAALMTGTKMNYEITMAFSDYTTNDALATIADTALQAVGPPKWTEEDYALAKEYLRSYDASTLKEIKATLAASYGEEMLEELWEKPLASTIRPYDAKYKPYESGSTDVGDVAYAVPTLNFNIATQCLGNVGHTWQNTGQSGSTIGTKGMLTAAKVMALAAIRTREQPEIIEKAKEIVRKQNGGTYECPLPNEVQPPIGTY